MEGKHHIRKQLDLTLTVAVFVLLLAAFLPGSAGAYKQGDLDKLMRTNACPKCDLSGAYLFCAQLREANLREANLSGANLYSATLTRANLTGANLTGAKLNAFMGGANLTGANLTEAELYIADLQFATLTGANLTRANISSADLRDAAMSEANLTGANLTGGTKLNRTNLTKATLRDADLNGANLQYVNMNGANLSGANLSGAFAPNANLSGASLYRATLDWAILGGTDLSKAILVWASLKNAILSGANLSQANLSQADLTGAFLDNANLTLAKWTDGSLCGPGSYGRCLPVILMAPPPSNSPYGSLTPELSWPAPTPVEGLTFKVRNFVLYEEGRMLSAIETGGLTATVPDGLLRYGRTYEYYVLDVSTTGELIGYRGGPASLTTPAKPDNVDDYGNPLVTQRLSDGTTLADASLDALIAAGGSLSQKAMLAAIRAAGGVLTDSDGLTLASLNVNDVRVVLSQGGQGKEVAMAASDRSVVATVKPLTESGYSPDASGNLKPDVAVDVAGVSLPLGLFDFTVRLDPSTNATTVVIVPPTPFDPGTKWYKVVNGTLTEFPHFQVDRNGNGILTLYDNDDYDRNKAFGIIRDPGGPGVAGGGGSGCFIATAAFGSYFHPSVKILRTFRDTVLLTSSYGKAFVSWYYRVSPPIADAVRASTIMKAGMRLALLPIVGIAYLFLTIGFFPTFAALLLLAAGGCIGLRRLCRPRRSCIN